jgi:hypothetical protein
MLAMFTQLRVSKTCLLVILLLLLILCGRGMAQQVYRESVVKSAILFNIVKFVEWPEDAFEGPESAFKVCVFGESLLQKELVKWGGSDFYGRPIDIEIVTDMNTLKEKLAACHLLYVAAERRRYTAEIIDLLGTRPILSVSDYGDFFREGGVVSLSEIDGKTHFSLNLDTATRCQLRISAKLAQLSHAVIKGGKMIGERR